MASSRVRCRAGLQKAESATSRGAAANPVSMAACSDSFPDLVSVGSSKTLMPFRPFLAGGRKDRPRQDVIWTLATFLEVASYAKAGSLYAP